MDFLLGSNTDASDSSSSSHSPVLGDFARRPPPAVFNPTAEDLESFDLPYSYTISVPTLENDAVSAFGGFIERMDVVSPDASEDHADSGS